MTQRPSTMPARTCRPDTTDARLIVIGLGLLGSHLVAHLVRLGSLLDELVLVDHDRYDRSNLAGQDITPSAIGHRKVAVQAQRLREIRSDIAVSGIARRVESVPLGQLRAGALISCLDSRLARQHVNEIAWRLGIPWIDAGVRAEQRLVRVTGYRPGEEAPCLECAWDEPDYAALEVVQSCTRREYPTGGPSSLGAVAAGLLALECEKLLEGREEAMLFSRQVTLDLEHHHQDLTYFTRNPRCRFDHESWSIDPLEIDRRRATARDLLARGRELIGEASAALRVAEAAMTTELLCPSCGRSLEALGVVGRWSGRRSRCASCRRDLLPNPIRTHDWLDDRSPAELLDRPLAALRLLDGDVVTLRGRRSLRRFVLRHRARAEGNHSKEAVR